jgi:hypothetical protein
VELIDRVQASAEQERDDHHPTRDAIKGSLDRESHTVLNHLDEG